MSSKHCFLFTDSYPYDIYFEQFIENEALYLSRAFEKVFVFPANVKETCRQYPVNFEIVDLNGMAKFTRLKFLLALPSVLKTIIIEIVHAKHKKVYFTRFIRKLKSGLNARITANTLNSWLECAPVNLNHTVLYSYWTMHWMHVIAYSKKKYPRLKVYCRAHTEMYEEIFDKLYADFNFTKYSAANGIFCISENAAAAIRRDYPEHKARVKVAYLGTTDLGFKENVHNNLFTIISCSTIHPRKQIHKIIEIIAHINFPLKWIHFGTGQGEYYEEICTQIRQLPETIQVELRGYTKNSEILNYYLQNKIDLFMNVSTAEGLPVSLVEAASFGIPLLGTNIFGTPEVVAYTGGILVDAIFDVREVAKEIMLKQSKFSSLKERSSIRKKWEERFNAEVNYPNFINEIQK